MRIGFDIRDRDTIINTIESILVEHPPLKKERPGANLIPVMRTEITTEGNMNPFVMTNIKFHAKGSIGDNRVISARLYYTGATTTFNTTNVLAMRSFAVSNEV